MKIRCSPPSFWLPSANSLKQYVFLISEGTSSLSRNPLILTAFTTLAKSSYTYSYKTTWYCCITEDEGLGEADSFLGQSPPSQPPGQPQAGIAPPTPSLSGTLGSQAGIVNRPSPTSTPPHGTRAGSLPPGSGLPPLAPTSQVPMSGAQMSATPPMPNTSGLYRCSLRVFTLLWFRCIVFYLLDSCKL